MSNIDQRLETGQSGVILWAIEAKSDKRSDFGSSLIFGPAAQKFYGLVPGLVPFAADGTSTSYKDSSVQSIGIISALDSFERADGTLVHWYAEPVSPGPYTLAYTEETARFLNIGFPRRFITSIGIPTPTGKNPADVTLAPDTPGFRVKPGDAVYIGTFGGDIRTREGAIGSKRAETITKYYRLVDSDAAGIVDRLNIDKKRLRIFNIFQARGRAWNAYVRPHHANDEP